MKVAIPITLIALVAAAIVFVPAATAEIDTARHLFSGDSPAGGGPMTIATGAEDGASGYLSIGLDEYGCFGNFGIAGSPYDEVFNPAGPDAGLEPGFGAFTAGLWFFVPGASQRELLCDEQQWQDVFGPEASLDRMVVNGNVASDTTGNGVDDTLTSTFQIVGTDTDITFDVVQSVAALGGGVSTLTQVYTLTNNSGLASRYAMVRSYDGDLAWDFDFSNDEVGTNSQAVGVNSVFEQEASLPGITAISLSGLNAYYGGKNGVDPGGAGLPYGFGTDVQLWEAFGVPTSWENHVAGVGYDTDGVSGTAPDGVVDPPDGFIGQGVEGILSGGATEVYTIVHTYGSTRPRDGLVLTIEGSCPDQVLVQLTGGPASSQVAVLTGTAEGNDPIPGGPCAGTISGLTSPNFLLLVPTDGNGGLFKSLSPNANGCGNFIQMVNPDGCVVSTVGVLD